MGEREREREEREEMRVCRVCGRECWRDRRVRESERKREEWVGREMRER